LFGAFTICIPALFGQLPQPSPTTPAVPPGIFIVPPFNNTQPSRELILQAAPKICSVPLLEMQIPKDVHFMLKEVPLPTEKKRPIDNMPSVRVPAPACQKQRP
jgi:hypothetical protein